MVYRILSQGHTDWHTLGILIFSLCMQEALMFAVIIPAWEDAKCWQALRDSDFCRHHLLLPAGQHGYCEGAQHNRYAVDGYNYGRLKCRFHSRPQFGHIVSS